MVEAAQPMIPLIPARVLQGHENTVSAVAIFPDRRRMVTGSADKTLRMWDLKDGVLSKQTERHGAWVQSLAVSGGGQLITNGDIDGEFIAWDGDTGEHLTQDQSPLGKDLFLLFWHPQNELPSVSQSGDRVRVSQSEDQVLLSFL
ncbi:WD40-repeat-containing domain protein, partial [Suillus subluteus]